jgi:hypothetical protein
MSIIATDPALDLVSIAEENIWRRNGNDMDKHGLVLTNPIKLANVNQ